MSLVCFPHTPTLGLLLRLGSAVRRPTKALISFAVGPLLWVLIISPCIYFGLRAQSQWRWSIVISCQVWSWEAGQQLSLHCPSITYKGANDTLWIKITKPVKQESGKSRDPYFPLGILPSYLFLFCFMEPIILWSKLKLIQILNTIMEDKAIHRPDWPQYTALKTQIIIRHLKGRIELYPLTVSSAESKGLPDWGHWMNRDASFLSEIFLKQLMWHRSWHPSGL